MAHAILTRSILNKKFPFFVSGKEKDKILRLCPLLSVTRCEGTVCVSCMGSRHRSGDALTAFQHRGTWGSLSIRLRGSTQGPLGTGPRG